MQKKIEVIIVESDSQIIKLLRNLFVKNEINPDVVSFVGSLEELLKIFSFNKDSVTHIGINGVSWNESGVESFSLEMKKEEFKGKIFAMSTLPRCNDTLKKIIGHGCRIVPSGPRAIKVETVSIIIGEIKRKQ